jgi:hypothetical protein
VNLRFFWGKIWFDDQKMDGSWGGSDFGLRLCWESLIRVFGVFGGKSKIGWKRKAGRGGSADGKKINIAIHPK